MTIGKMRHRVLVCAWTETPDEDVSIIRKRPGVFEAWAKLEPIKASRVYDSKIAYGDENKTTHEAYIRRPSDVFITSRHWVYTETRGAKRWFRVHGVEEIEERGCYLKLLLRETEIDDPRRDPVTQKEPKNFEVPEGGLYGSNAGL